MHLSQSTWALRQARAGSKGEVCVNLRSARSDLQYLIKNFRKKYLFLLLRHDFRHGIGPLVAPVSRHKSVHTQSIREVHGKVATIGQTGSSSFYLLVVV